MNISRSTCLPAPSWSLSQPAFVAGCARGFSGFGGALIFVPVASSLVGAKLAVPLLLIVDLVLTPGLIPKAWRNADRANVGVMALGGGRSGCRPAPTCSPMSTAW